MSFQSATGLGHRPTDEALVRQTKSWSASADAVVFVIESDDPARNAIKQLLEFVGLHVEPFRSAVEFLDGVVPEKPCCVVLALRMPMMTGLHWRRNSKKPAFMRRLSSSPDTEASPRRFAR